MTKILNLAEYRHTWEQAHPHDVVVKRAPEGINWLAMVGVFISLLAVNFLSAAHTLPVVVQLVETDNQPIKIAVAFAAFLGLEFMMLVLVAFGKDGRLRTALIILALIATTVSNLASTFAALATSEYGAGGVIVGIILGLFAPLANVGIGELYRQMTTKARNELTIVESEYQHALNVQDDKIRTQYNRYLTKIGITDPSEILAYMNGDNNVPTEVKILVDSVPPKPEPKPTRVRAQTVGAGARNNSRSAEWLAEQLLADEATNLTYAEIQARYGTSPSTISKAKKLLQ